MRIEKSRFLSVCLCMGIALLSLGACSDPRTQAEEKLAQARSFLSDNDRKYLFDCIRLITFELGLRFFADYIAGDKYFKVRHDGQNLNRARVQFKLTESIETREKQIRGILERQ